MTTPVVTGFFGKLKLRLQGYIPERYREAFYRLSSGAVMLLTSLGVANSSPVMLWTNLAIGTATALFALLYSTSSVRSILYGVVGPLGAVLMGYGIVSDAKWAIIVAAAGQVFGSTTAAAKVVERDKPEVTSPADAAAVRSYGRHAKPD